ncbi:hypothetical protein B0H14DRAFT_2588242 [Mycena olivaceomarginata]|nr:hypothetical protein B0H14DRAFT_2588242 [Mycena olivaceomarginata]
MDNLSSKLVLYELRMVQYGTCSDRDSRKVKLSLLQYNAMQLDNEDVEQWRHVPNTSPASFSQWYRWHASARFSEREQTERIAASELWKSFRGSLGLSVTGLVVHAGAIKSQGFDTNNFVRSLGLTTWVVVSAPRTGQLRFNSPSSDQTTVILVLYCCGRRAIAVVDYVWTTVTTMVLSWWPWSPLDKFLYLLNIFEQPPLLTFEQYQAQQAQYQAYRNAHNTAATPGVPESSQLSQTGFQSVIYLPHTPENFGS